MCFNWYGFDTKTFFVLVKTEKNSITRFNYFTHEDAYYTEASRETSMAFRDQEISLNYFDKF